MCVCMYLDQLYRLHCDLSGIMVKGNHPQMALPRCMSIHMKSISNPYQIIPKVVFMSYGMYVFIHTKFFYDTFYIHIPKSISK